MRVVIWTDQSLSDVRKIALRIAFDAGPQTSADVTARLFAAGDALNVLPERGRTSSRGRELVTQAPYIISYRVFRRTVLITGVRHGARRPLP